jgi:Zn-dependent protease with chaperone function
LLPAGSETFLLPVALYGTVFAIGDVVLVSHQVSLWWGIVFAVAVIAFQYAISPWMIERVLDIDWDESALPPSKRAFVERLCAERRLPQLRIGVIHSDTPNAFSFGHARSNARVVVTEGLLDVPSAEAANAILAHEISHIAHYDFAVMATAAVAPLILCQIYIWAGRINNARAVAWGAYCCFWIGQFILRNIAGKHIPIAD